MKGGHVARVLLDYEVRLMRRAVKRSIDGLLRASVLVPILAVVGVGSSATRLVARPTGAPAPEAAVAQGGRGGAGAAPAQGEPPAGARGPAGDPRANVGPSDRPRVDVAAAERGRTLWGTECVSCHGAQARGTNEGPSLLSSAVVFEDRNGNRLGPFLEKGHPTRSGRPSAVITDAQVVDLVHFVLQRRNETLRGGALFNPKDVLTGDAKAGADYFNGPGGCATCHTSTTNTLAGIGTRVPTAVALQQRMLFPSGGRGFGGRGARGAGPGGAPSPTAVTVTLTPATGAPMSGALVGLDDFYVRFSDAAGQLRVVRRTPTLRVVVNDPMKAHHDLLDRITDKNIHDLTAYLVTLK
ncbi:MAG: cytochrome c [Vicinamibacterales bacterium]